MKCQNTCVTFGISIFDNEGTHLMTTIIHAMCINVNAVNVKK